MFPPETFTHCLPTGMTERTIQCSWGEKSTTLYQAREVGDDEYLAWDEEDEEEFFEEVNREW